jgi:hypothetical protein
MQEDYEEFFVHNLNFDGLILIDEITKHKINFDFFSRNSNLYSLKIKYFNKTILLRCSYKLIPSSLKNLGKLENFNKLFFPYMFVNYNTLYYIGPIPEKKF